MRTFVIAVLFVISSSFSPAFGLAGDSPQVTMIVGTNAPGRVGLGLLRAVKSRLVAEGAGVSVIHLRKVQLNFFYGAPTDEFLRVEAGLRGSDGIVVLVPEYNGSYPGILKLFLDQLDYPASPLADKFATFVGYSGGDAGGRVPVETLSRDFQTQGANIYSKRTFLPRDLTHFSEEGELTDPEVGARLDEQMHGFVSLLVSLKRGRAAGPRAELFSREHRLAMLRNAGLNPDEVRAAVTAPRTEKAMVDAEIAFFRAHHPSLTSEQQAVLWEEMSRDIDEKLNYSLAHVSTGYLWAHDGATYYVFQGPLAFKGGQHATLIIGPKGDAWAGLAGPIAGIERWSVNLSRFKPL